MQVELTIAGLCLFVDDPSEEVVHVLFPATDGHHEHAKHEAHVIYPKRVGREREPVTGYAFDLRRHADGTAFRPTLPTDVLDMAEVCESAGKVIHDIVAGAHDAKSGHLTLRGGEFTIEHRECCVVNGQQVERAGRLTWRTTWEHAPAALVGVSLTAGGSDRSVALVEDEGVIRLGIVYATVGETPEWLDELRTVGSSHFEHFSLFSRFFHGACSEVPETCVAIRSPSQCMPVRGAV